MKGNYFFRYKSSQHRWKIETILKYSDIIKITIFKNSVCEYH